MLCVLVCRAGHCPSPVAQGIEPIRDSAFAWHLPACNEACCFKVHCNEACKQMHAAASCREGCREHTAPARCNRPALVLPTLCINQPVPWICSSQLCAHPVSFLLPSAKASAGDSHQVQHHGMRLQWCTKQHPRAAVRMDQEQQEEPTRVKSDLHTQLTAAFVSTCSA